VTTPDDRQGLWDRLMAPLQSPGLFRKGMSVADAQTVLDIGGRVERLLEFGAVLPVGLVVMLRDFLPGLADLAGGRWEGAGLPSQALGLCERIGWGIAEGEWKPGDRIYSGDYCELLSHSPATLHCAMQVLAARGDVIIRPDGYYVRGPR
jgi:hypothetical protein